MMLCRSVTVLVGLGPTHHTVKTLGEGWTEETIRDLCTIG